MRKRELENLLKNEIESHVPFVLPEVLKTPCEIEEVIESANVKTKDKPYFQFRYIYASLVILTILMVGFSTMIPQAKTNGILSGGMVVAEEYEVYTTLNANDIQISMISDEDDKVVSLVINGVSQPVAVGKSVEKAAYYIAGILNSVQINDGILVDVESKSTYKPENDVSRITNLFKVVLGRTIIEL